jgi:hypothetical protein
VVAPFATTKTKKVLRIEMNNPELHQDVMSRVKTITLRDLINAYVPDAPEELAARNERVRAARRHRVSPLAAAAEDPRGPPEHPHGAVATDAPSAAAPTDPDTSPIGFSPDGYGDIDLFSFDQAGDDQDGPIPDSSFGAAHQPLGYGGGDGPGPVPADAVTGEDDEESAGMDFEAFLALARGETGADEDETAIFSIGARTGVTKATYSHRSRLLVSRWRPEDDRQLLAAVALHGTDLALVQKKLPTRTRTQIKRRLAILSKTTPHLVRNAILASLGVAGGDAVVRPDGTVVPMIPPHGITPQITPLATASATDRLASAAVLDATRALIAQADAESAVRNAEEAAENAGAEAQARALFGQAEAEAEVMALFGLAPEAGEEAEGAPAPPQELANTPVDAPVTGFEDLYDPEMFGGEIDLYGMDDDM